MRRLRRRTERQQSHSHGRETGPYWRFAGRPGDSVWAAKREQELRCAVALLSRIRARKQCRWSSPPAPLAGRTSMTSVLENLHSRTIRGRRLACASHETSGDTMVLFCHGFRGEKTGRVCCRDR